jgi:hypothetical protein
VTQRLADLNLAEALPPSLPPADLIDKSRAASALDSGPSEELRRANAWAAALQQAVGERPAPGGELPVLTTYGFVAFDNGVRLCVIHYLRLRAAFRARAPQPIELAGHRFAVIVRPWLVRAQRGSPGTASGTCWVKFPGNDGDPGHGILAAAHTVRPTDAADGDQVTLDAARAEPPGRLRHRSPKMDAAVIEVEPDRWEATDEVHISTVVGYKPVRLMGASGSVETDVVEHDGFAGATIPGQPGAEPRAPAQLILGAHLDRGDSGCLGLDLEFERLDPSRQTPPTPPYLLYQGMTNLRWGGIGGYALMLEQARIVWGLDFYR